MSGPDGDAGAVAALLAHLGVTTTEPEARQAATPAELEELTALLTSPAAVTSLSHLTTLPFRGGLFVAARLDVDGRSNLSEVSRTVAALETRLRDTVPRVTAVSITAHAASARRNVPLPTDVIVIKGAD